MVPIALPDSGPGNLDRLVVWRVGLDLHKNRMPIQVDVMCAAPDCEELIDPKRVALGYKTCIYCGSPRKQFTVAIAANKGAYEVIPESQVHLIGRK